MTLHGSILTCFAYSSDKWYIYLALAKQVMGFLVDNSVTFLIIEKSY